MPMLSEIPLLNINSSRAGHISILFRRKEEREKEEEERGKQKEGRMEEEKKKGKDDKDTCRLRRGFLTSAKLHPEPCLSL